MKTYYQYDDEGFIKAVVNSTIAPIEPNQFEDTVKSENFLGRGYKKDTKEVYHIETNVNGSYKKLLGKVKKDISKPVVTIS